MFDCSCTPRVNSMTAALATVARSRRVERSTFPTPWCTSCRMRRLAPTTTGPVCAPCGTASLRSTRHSAQMRRQYCSYHLLRRALKCCAVNSANVRFVRAFTRNPPPPNNNPPRFIIWSAVRNLQGGFIIWGDLLLYVYPPACPTNNKLCLRTGGGVYYFP